MTIHEGRKSTRRDTSARMFKREGQTEQTKLKGVEIHVRWIFKCANDESTLTMVVGEVPLE